MERQSLIAEFISHLFPRRIRRDNLKTSYTFCLGGLAMSCFLISSFSGLLLLFYYLPHPQLAYSSIILLEENILGGRFLRSLHRLSGQGMLVFTFLHMLRVIWTGAYKQPKEINWLIGCALLLLCLAIAYTGYLLPMDRSGYWAAQTGMKLINTLPLGKCLSDILVPDQIGGPLCLLRFYVLHVLILPLLICLLCLLHFYRIRKDQGLLPYL